MRKIPITQNQTPRDRKQARRNFKNQRVSLEDPASKKTVVGLPWSSSGLRLSACNAGGEGSIPGQELRPHTPCCVAKAFKKQHVITGRHEIQKTTSACVCSVVSNSATPWTVALQASLSMGFSRSEYWGGLPFPSPGDLPDPGVKPSFLAERITGIIVVNSFIWKPQGQTAPGTGLSEAGIAQGLISS